MQQIQGIMLASKGWVPATYPYHYRGHDGTKADMEEFKRLDGKPREVPE